MNHASHINNWWQAIIKSEAIVYYEKRGQWVGYILSINNLTPYWFRQGIYWQTSLVQQKYFSHALEGSLW